MNSYQEVIEAWLAPHPPEGKDWWDLSYGNLRVSMWGDHLFRADRTSAYKAKETRRILVSEEINKDLLGILTHVAESYGWEIVFGKL